MERAFSHGVSSIDNVELDRRQSQWFMILDRVNCDENMLRRLAFF
ncbi:hypothetical protein RRSWK_03384 [Rhodopirellula sp. SWK7]|nr:hypothetical protein RRSWK_03384 [Rhodopirellula sp. SWK7]